MAHRKFEDFPSELINLHLWLGFSMAMLNNQRVYKSSFNGCLVGLAPTMAIWASLERSNLLWFSPSFWRGKSLNSCWAITMVDSCWQRSPARGVESWNLGGSCRQCHDGGAVRLELLEVRDRGSRSPVSPLTTHHSWAALWSLQLVFFWWQLPAQLSSSSRADSVNGYTPLF